MIRGSLLRPGGAPLRVSPWRGGEGVALVAPAPGARLPDPDTVRHCMEELAGRGIRRVVTGALAAPEQAPFLAAGFRERERLQLLVHDLRALPPPPPVGVRRARRSDRPAVLAVDGLAFDDFWQLDLHGLDEAVHATPVSRLRVVGDGDAVAYAVTGRAGRRGYVQRLAVHPAHQRRGLGTALVLDGLRWLRRHAAEQAVVNTQEANGAALALYRHLGFRTLPEGLSVLGTDLPAP